MGKRLLGRLTVSMNNQPLLTNKDCSFELADEEGKEQMGDLGLNGIIYTPNPGVVECSISVSDDVDLQALRPSVASDVTCLVQGDAGGTWSFPHASQLTKIKATGADGGKVALRFVSATSPKVG